jgi:hypothetical protein
MTRFSITIILSIIGTLAIAVTSPGFERFNRGDVVIIGCKLSPVSRVDGIDVSFDMPELCGSGAGCASCLSLYREIGFIIKDVTSPELDHVVYTLIR